MTTHDSASIIKQLVAECRTIAALAKKSGYGEETVRQWYHGITRPSYQGIVDCLGACGYEIKIIKNM